MPFRRKVKRKRKGAGAKKKRMFNRRNIMYNRMPARAHSVVAPKYFTTIRASFQGYLESSANPLQANYFTIKGNDIALPFNTSANFTAMTGASLRNEGTVTISDLQPAGLLQLQDLYYKFRVHASRLNVTFTPQAFSTAMELTVLPYNAVSGPPADYYDAKSAPYSKTRMCIDTNNIKQNTIVSKMMSYTVLGCTKEQYRCNEKTEGTITVSNSVVSEWNWQVYYAAFADATLASDVFITVSIDYMVELFSPLANLETQQPP